MRYVLRACAPRPARSGCGRRPADAEYDHAAQRVSVALNAFTRLASILGGGAHLRQPWLPATARVTEHLPHTEVDEFLKDVFGTWIKKLRDAIPAELPLRT